MKLRYLVFGIPFLLLTGSVGYSLYDSVHFLAVVRGMNDWIIREFGWLFAGAALGCLVLCVMVYISPLGRVRIGGPAAQPLLSRWRWFSITLCTTIAIGILFWATAEPLYHLHQPPAGTGITPNTPAAARFALSTMFLHWTFTPYSLYTITALLFALVYYNLRQPFRLGSLLFPLLGRHSQSPAMGTLDAVCLYSLVAGMSASLGAGLLTIAGGLRQFAHIPAGNGLLALIAAAIVGVFVISSVSGLQRGIRVLSDINIRAFLLLAAFIFLLGPKGWLWQTSLGALADYAGHFLPRSLAWGLDPQWAGSWTIFYWANWLAWTPITALFLGRLGVGYTVREFLRVNLLFPALFSMAWMIIFSGNALYLDLQVPTANLFATLQAEGPEGAVYAVLRRFPWPLVTSFFFLAVTFLSYVTAADSNTSAMSGLCSTGISPEDPEAPVWIKMAWGVVVGSMAWVMVANAGIDGVKMASNLGGFPALFLILAVMAGMVVMLFRSREV
ncbi:MAG: BCCT family transporter [Lewinellaceae bacterium]|nr:BCCT family transporter [Lewinellaceae bacterium]